jgi:hypothetical protein
MDAIAAAREERQLRQHAFGRFLLWCRRFDRWLARPILVPATAAAIAVYLTFPRASSLAESSPPVPSLWWAVPGALAFACVLAAPNRSNSDKTSHYWNCLWPVLTTIALVGIGSWTALWARASVTAGAATPNQALSIIFLFSIAIAVVLVLREFSLGALCNAIGEAARDILKQLWPLLSVVAIAIYALTSGAIDPTAFAEIGNIPAEIENGGLRVVPVSLDDLVTVGALILKAVAIYLALLLLFLVIEELRGHFWLVFSAALTMFAIAYNLDKGVHEIWNWLFCGLLGEPPWLAGQPGKAAAPGDAPVALDNTVGVLLALLSAGTVTVTASSALSETVEDIKRAQGWSPTQRNAAVRLRHRAIDAVPADRRLDKTYANEIRINKLSHERRFPFENVGGARKTRVKLLIRSGHRTEKDHNFDSGWIQDLIDSKRGEIDKCLFMIYLTEDSKPSEVVCYCTGTEFLELSGMQSLMPHSDTKVSDALYEAMNLGEADRVRTIVEHARHEMLNKQPGREVLLSAVTESGSHELAHVMKTMSTGELGRILLVGARGVDLAILGGEEISRYLLKD